MRDLFSAAAAIVVDGVEKGDSDDPQDPGGFTRFGIALARHPELTRDQLVAMTQDEALAFIRKKYWDPFRFGDMPWRWALAVFDCEFNQGGHAVAWLEEAEGLVEDGKVGGLVLAAMNGKYNDDLFDAFMAIRLEHYAIGAGAARFGRGWKKRIVHIVRAGEHPPIS